MQLSRTGREWATEIIMLRTAEPDTAFVLVEGNTEKAIYEGFFSKQATIFPTQGSAKALEAIEILNQQKKNRGVIVLLDADFRVLEGEDIPDHTFLTDVSDLELLLIQSPALEKVLRATLSSQKNINDFDVFGQKLRNEALIFCLPAGYLRWVGHRHPEYNLSFKAIEFDKIIQFEQSTCDEKTMIEKACQNENSPSPEVVRPVYDRLKSKKADAWHVCRGHDYIAVMAHILPSFTKRETGSRMEEREKTQTLARELSRTLRLSYELRFFARTTLYQHIRNWETANRPFRVLPAVESPPNSR